MLFRSIEDEYDGVVLQLETAEGEILAELRINRGDFLDALESQKDELDAANEKISELENRLRLVEHDKKVLMAGDEARSTIGDAAEGYLVEERAEMVGQLRGEVAEAMLEMDKARSEAKTVQKEILDSRAKLAEIQQNLAAAEKQAFSMKDAEVRRITEMRSEAPAFVLSPTLLLLRFILLYHTQEVCS